MRPYYSHAGIRIFHGDCRELLPELKADVLVTDPPYGVNLNTDSTRFSGGTPESIKQRGQGRADHIRLAGDDEPFDPRLLLTFGTKRQIIWGWNNFPNLLPSGACLVWVKRNDEAFGSFLSDAELAWMSVGCGVFCFKDVSGNSGLRNESSNGRQHPTQKPESLLRWCLKFSKPSETVIDPFMGVGTTLRAAKDLGRHAIGIEMEERYCEVAARRMSQDVLIESQRFEQPALFDLDME